MVSDAFITLFGYPCCILTQYGIFFLHSFSYKHLLLQLYKTILTKYNLIQNVTFFSSIPHGFFNIITADMINDLKHSHTQRPLPPIKSSHRLSTII